MMYKTCPDCGSNNDPGERCDCLKWCKPGQNRTAASDIINVEAFDILEFEKLINNPNINIEDFNFGGFDPAETKELNKIRRNLKKKDKK